MSKTQHTIPEQGLTVSQIYHFEQPDDLLFNQPVMETHLEPLDPTFKALPNPEIPIYVFAHVVTLDDEQIIKPAYTTRFFLYKHNHYALASELY